jgi:hypothetical protein
MLSLIYRIKNISVYSVFVLGLSLSLAKASVINVSTSQNFDTLGINVCSDFGASTASCNTKSYIFDEVSNTFTLLTSLSQAATEGTALRAEAGFDFQSRLTIEQVAEEIRTSIGLTDNLSDDEFFRIVEQFPQFFDDELNFNLDRFLNEETLLNAPQFTTEASASLRDTLLITGGEDGAGGVLTLAYAIDGAIGFDSVVFTEGNFSRTQAPGASLRLIETQTIAQQNGVLLTQTVQEDVASIFAANFGAESGNEFIDDIFEVSLDFIFGQEIEIRLFLNAFAGFDFAGVIGANGSPESFFARSDFFNTAVFSSLNVFDTSGSSVDFSLVSSNGFSQFERVGGATPVNVSSPSLLLLTLGGLVLVVVRRLKQ